VKSGTRKPRSRSPTDEDETVNQASALWARPKGEITEEQYKEFYKHVGHDFEDPLTWTHARVEGKTEYTQLLYVPARAPFDLWDRNAKHGIKLYVRRVFIMDDAEQLMPTYLRFVRGIVDSADLPLNVSREILQESKDIEAIRKGCTAKVLGLLDAMAGSDEAAEKEKYAKFWGEFGKVLKEGMGEDFANKDKIAGLLRFASTLADTPDETVSLKDYIGRMKPEQEKIYYVTAETFNAAKNSPHLEVFRKKGIEVILLSDRVDEWVVSHLTEFEGKAMVSVAKGGLDLGKLEDEAEKKEQESAADEFKDLTGKIAKSLGEKVKEVRVTHRLTDSPALPGGGRARRFRQPGAHPQGGRAEGAQRPAHPRNQPQAPGGAAPKVRREKVRRLGGGAVRPGPARRGRPARRPGNLRQAHEPVDAGDERRLGRHQPCRHTGESRCPVP
jgi:molecular chaperone HtpG